MVDAIRKQLDELMGVNRNGDRPQKLIEHFWDKRLCKYSLLGLCPYELFPNTKQDLGKCPAEVCPVPEKYKKEYEQERKFRNYGYERDLQRFLERLVRECDERITRAKHRLEAQNISVPTEPEELIKLRKDMEELTKKIEELGNEGQVDEAAALLHKLEQLKVQKEQLEAKHQKAKEQQLIVCEVCGALLSVNESDQRLADHFAGKMHLGFQKIRDKLVELHELRKNEKERPPPERSNPRSRDRGDRYDRRYDRGYYRPRERYDRYDRYSRSSRKRRERSYSPYDRYRRSRSRSGSPKRTKRSPRRSPPPPPPN